MSVAFFQNELVRAFCWMLIHSLWQGLLLAAVAGIALWLAKKASAAARYNMLIGIFAIALITSAATFIHELHSSPSVGTQAISQVSQGSNSPLLSNWQGGHIATSGYVFGNLKHYFNEYASFIVAAWFIVFIVRFVKLAVGFTYLQHIRNYKVYQPPVYWQDALAELITTIGIKQHVTLMESAIVKVPVVLGTLKPLILIPIGLLCHLPQKEMEAILLHELAHIKRRDYFVNILQGFAGTVFFFNPAMVWLSAMISEEREHCCDDIAIDITHNKAVFVSALISFQEYKNVSRYALAFPGKKGHLMSRVKRILNKGNNASNFTQKSVLGISTAACILLFFVAARSIPNIIYMPGSKSMTSYHYKSVVKEQSTTTTHIQSVENVTAIQASTNIVNGNSGRKDTVTKYTNTSVRISDNGRKREEEIVVRDICGNEFRLKKNNNAVTEFYVNDILIDQNKWGQYTQKINELSGIGNAQEEAPLKNKPLKDDNIPTINENLAALQEHINMVEQQHIALDEHYKKLHIDGQRQLADNYRIQQQAFAKEAHEKKARVLSKMHSTQTINLPIPPNPPVTPAISPAPVMPVKNVEPIKPVKASIQAPVAPVEPIAPIMPVTPVRLLTGRLYNGLLVS